MGHEMDGIQKSLWALVAVFVVSVTAVVVLVISRAHDFDSACEGMGGKSIFVDRKQQCIQGSAK